MPKLIYHKADWWRDRFNVYGFYFQDHSQLTLHGLATGPWYDRKHYDNRKTYTLLLDRTNIFVNKYTQYKL
jgi:hypothetical protein